MLSWFSLVFRCFQLSTSHSFCEQCAQTWSKTRKEAMVNFQHLYQLPGLATSTSGLEHTSCCTTTELKY